VVDEAGVNERKVEEVEVEEVEWRRRLKWSGGGEGEAEVEKKGVPWGRPCAP